MCQNTAPHLHPPGFPIGAYDTKLHFSVVMCPDNIFQYTDQICIIFVIYHFLWPGFPQFLFCVSKYIRKLCVCLFHSPVCPTTDNCNCDRQIQLYKFPIIHSFAPISFNSFSIISLFLYISNKKAFFFLKYIPCHVYNRICDFIIDKLSKAMRFSYD